LLIEAVKDSWEENDVSILSRELLISIMEILTLTNLIDVPRY
jgi:hypothetical protein